MTTIRTLVVDDHKIVREGLVMILSNETDIEVIAEADNGRDAVNLVGKLQPDVTLMDISMPGLNGIEALKQIHRKQPDARIIVLSMHTEHDFIWKTFKAGAYAYLVKGCAAMELLTTVRKVYSGKKYISESVSDVVLQDFVNSKWHEKEVSNSPLTNRETEVLQLLCEGKPNKDIAELLFISIKTVESHRKNIMEKLQIFTLPELTKYAIKMGLTSLD